MVSRRLIYASLQNPRSIYIPYGPRVLFFYSEEGGLIMQKEQV